MLGFGTLCIMNLSGAAKKIKFETFNENNVCKFEISKAQYVSKDKPDSWVNYSVTVYGKTVELLRKSFDDGTWFQDGCIVVISGEHKQNKKEHEGTTYVYNNLSTNDVHVVLGADKLPAREEKEPESPSQGDEGEGEDDGY